MPKATSATSRSSSRVPTATSKKSHEPTGRQWQQPKGFSNSTGNARRPNISPRTTRSKWHHKLESTGTDADGPYRLQQLPIGKRSIPTLEAPAPLAVLEEKNDSSGLNDAQSAAISQAPTRPAIRNRSSFSTTVNQKTRAAASNTRGSFIGVAKTNTSSRDATNTRNSQDSRFGVNKELVEQSEFPPDSPEMQAGNLPVLTWDLDQVLQEHQHARKLESEDHVGSGNNDQEPLGTDGGRSKNIESNVLPMSNTNPVEQLRRRGETCEEKENYEIQGLKRRYSLMDKGSLHLECKAERRETGTLVYDSGARIPLILKSINRGDPLQKYRNRVGALQYKQKNDSGPQALLSASTSTTPKLAEQPDTDELSSSAAAATKTSKPANFITSSPAVTKSVAAGSVYEARPKLLEEPISNNVNDASIINDTSPLPSFICPPTPSQSPLSLSPKKQIRINLSLNVVSGRTSHGAAAYKLTIAVPPSSSSTMINNIDDQILHFSSKVSFSALPEGWIASSAPRLIEGSPSSNMPSPSCPTNPSTTAPYHQRHDHASKRRKAGLGFSTSGLEVDKSIPAVKIHLYIIPNLFNSLRGTGRLTSLQIEIIRHAIIQVLKRIISKHGVEFVGTVSEWGVCCISPIHPVSGGGDGMVAEVIIRRANGNEGDWLMERGERGQKSEVDEMLVGVVEEEEEEEGLWGEENDDSEIFINNVDARKRKRGQVKSLHDLGLQQWI